MEPLAYKLMPKKLEDIIGQKHLVGNNGFIYKMIKNNKLTSIILYGKPGIGKTTIANVICNELNVPYEIFNASNDNKATLIKLINDLLTPTSGEVLINGEKPGVESKKVISYLPERTYLDKDMKVKQVIKYFEEFYDNFNADTAAAEIAAALGAENIITLTDIPGLLRDVNDPTTLISEIHVDEVASLIDSGIISGGMIPKMLSCEKAVRCGVKKAVMIDGRVPHSILIEMFSKEGIGTLMTK